MASGSQSSSGYGKKSLWIMAGVAALALFPIGIIGSALTRGYNDDLCFSTRVDRPVGASSYQIESSYMSREVRCVYGFPDGRTQTLSFEVGTYTSWLFLTIAYGAPILYTVVGLITLIRS